MTTTKRNTVEEKRRREKLFSRLIEVNNKRHNHCRWEKSVFHPKAKRPRRVNYIVEDVLCSLFVRWKISMMMNYTIVVYIVQQWLGLFRTLQGQRSAFECALIEREDVGNRQTYVHTRERSIFSDSMNPSSSLPPPHHIVITIDIFSSKHITSLVLPTPRVHM